MGIKVTKCCYQAEALARLPDSLYRLNEHHDSGSEISATTCICAPDAADLFALLSSTLKPHKSRTELRQDPPGSCCCKRGTPHASGSVGGSIDGPEDALYAIDVTIKPCCRGMAELSTRG